MLDKLVYTTEVEWSVSCTGSKSLVYPALVEKAGASCTEETRRKKVLPELVHKLVSSKLQ